MDLAIHGPGFCHHVSTLLQFGRDAHLLRHIEPRAPKVDQVSATVQLPCMFDDGDVVPRLVQPERHRRAGNSGTHNQNLHDETSIHHRLDHLSKPLV